jgi:hypothetical protein
LDNPSTVRGRTGRTLCDPAGFPRVIGGTPFFSERDIVIVTGAFGALALGGLGRPKKSIFSAIIPQRSATVLPGLLKQVI